MSYLSRLFSTHNLKFLMLLLCALLVAAAIWYLGPFSGFGEVHPLESVSARCLCILVVWLWIARLWWRIPFFIPLALSASVLVWVAGPWLLAGKSYPLAAASRRLAIIAIIWLVVLLYALWLLVVALIHNPALLNRLKGVGKPAVSPAEKYTFITRQIRHAVALTSRARTHWKRWWTLLLPGILPETIPWYVLLGDENSGKTSLVIASGQDFPLPEQLSRTSQQNPPTASCECWFGNDALFLDTAGKYISSEAADDEWQHLLKTLHKYRARDGINGAIVAVPAADLLQGSKESKLALATRLRARLAELRQQLGVHFPVYVTITKVDHLSGFEPWFRSMTREARDQVWGVTFPWGEMVNTSTNGLQQKIARELDVLQQRLASTLHPRQQEEYSLQDRKAMYTFPLDFQLLCNEVADFLQQAFFSSRYDETQFCASFRGIYFSSSCQQADTRLHNHKTVVSRWRRYFVSDRPETEAFSAEQAIPEEEVLQSTVWGKHYFLRQLFADVIVKDATLATPNFREATRFRMQRLFSHIALLLLAVILIRGLTLSYDNNSTYLDAVIAKTQQLEKAVAPLKQLPEGKILASLLAMAHDLPEFDTLNLLDPALDYRYGLYTGKPVARHANALYRYMLERFFLPALQNQASASLNAALQDKSENDEQLYQALKIYLGIFGQGQASKDWLSVALTQQWDSQDKLTAYGDESVFQAHLSALFAGEKWLQYGQKADTVLIAQARSALGQRSLNARLYQRVKSVELAQAPEPMTLDKMTGDSSAQIFTVTDEQLARDGIPGFFTRAGYQMLIKKKFLLLITQLQREDQWVMGTKTEAAPNPLTVREGVLRLYLREYSSLWSRLLDSIRLIPLDEVSSGGSPLAGDIYLLRILASPNSPLVNLARVSVEQTTLVQKDKNLPELLDDGNNRFTSNRLVSQAKKLDDAADALIKKLTRAEVDDRFRALHEFVNGQGNALAMESSLPGLPGSQLNKLSSTLGELYTLFVVTSNNLSNGETPVMPDTSMRIGIQAQTWPTPFRTVVEPFIRGASQKVQAQVLASNSKNVDNNLGAVCRETLANRYPFRESAQEVTLHDFRQFFARDGLVDSWFKQNLADKVDTSQPVWRYKGTQSEGNLAFFQQVARIRNAFFNSDDGKKMQLTPTLSVAYMDPAIVQLNMNIGGSPFRYIHGPVVPWLFNWPGTNGSTNINISALPALPGSASPVSLNSPWALFRWMDQAALRQTDDNGNILLTYFVDKRRMDITLGGMVSDNSTLSGLLKGFECPTDN